MCGRFVRAKAAEFYSDFFGVPDVPKLFASFNVAPTQRILALRTLPCPALSRLARRAQPRD